jgi:hypothetical protein
MPVPVPTYHHAVPTLASTPVYHYEPAPQPQPRRDVGDWAAPLAPLLTISLSMSQCIAIVIALVLIAVLIAALVFCAQTRQDVRALTRAVAKLRKRSRRTA